MPEAAIVILDNSDYSINGDYQPTRWLAQIEAAGLLIQTKMQQNHENAMGIALSAGKQVQIICTPATDLTKVSSYLYGIKQHGHQKLAQALQTSALALKHRANQALSQRIICFIASTITDSLEQLRIICKKLKKNNIHLDLLVIGDLSPPQRKVLEDMHQIVKGQGQSQLIFVQPTGNLSNAIFSSKLIGAEPANNQMLNQENDPELLMALQLSLQEEQARAGARAAQRGQEEEQLQRQALQLAMDEEQMGNQGKKDENGGEGKK